MSDKGPSHLIQIKFRLSRRLSAHARTPQALRPAAFLCVVNEARGSPLMRHGSARLVSACFST